MKPTIPPAIPTDLKTNLQKLLVEGSASRNELLELGQQLVHLGTKPRPLVFATPKYERFAEQVVQASNGWLELGRQERKTFADGKTWHRYADVVEGRKVVLIGGTQTDKDQMELYRMGCNAWMWNAHKLTMLIPYHGDARQERAQMEGESVDGLFASSMFTSIHKCPGGNEALLVDIHADAVTGFFLGGGMRCRNIEVLKTLIREMASECFGGTCTVAAPDAGRGKVVSKVAKELGLNLAIACKSRSGDKTETQGLIGDVADTDAILSDDIIVSGGSLIGAGRLLKQQGAKRVGGVVTHCLTEAKHIENMIKSQVFDWLVVTDSDPRAHRLAKRFPKFLRVKPLAPLVVPYLIG